MRFNTLSITLGLNLLIAAPAIAQTAPSSRESFKFLSAEKVEALTGKPGAGPTTAHLAEHAGFDVEYALRSDLGNQVEVHAHRTHYIHILDGRGTLTYGGTVTSPTKTAPGEIRGKAVLGGTVISLHAGDYLQIPAGMPHLFNAIHGARLRYIVFNIKS